MDVLIISKTKISETFPSRQFFIEVFTPTYRLNRKCRRGDILVHFTGDIPSKLIEIVQSKAFVLS